MKPLELYIHIPFCISKCKYCDFLSGPSLVEDRQSYVESLLAEIRSYENLAKAYCVMSVFVGGGTPSILDTKQIESIFKAINETFMLSKDAEITIEMNPGTANRAKLKVYHQIGINRLSIGLQSVNNDELKMLGRIHTYEEFLQTYKMAREEGFSNINIDLMSAIPGQTIASWEQTLRTAADLEPEHISAYSLIIEEGTTFYELYGEGKEKKEITEDGAKCADGAAKLPDEDAERLMYQRTKAILEEYGYHRYEISNYAREGYECRHNLGYWERTEYLGIGAGAASLLDNRRWVQSEDVQRFADESKRRMEEAEILTKEEQMEEFMFLGLRKMEGVSRRIFENTFGCTLESVYKDIVFDMIQKKLLKDTGDFLCLTEKGIDVSNYVMSEFLL